ncbi:hypothetical protein BBI17_008846 [Phytophthora kernoviae]|uniref:Peptidase S1 domain-containing protein n=1 Tax=Phytophthora kernoviae TaxID=325452 RepID=A0A3R7J8P3_9STRA|nr:hypothetical protein BBI17_008846 [Phytophthora kernoviae]
MLACAVNTYGSNIERKLIVGGDVVPANTKTYMTGLRATIGGNSLCGGSLISPTHVLTASHCVGYDIRWASIGSHFRNGTQNSEQIRVISIMNHPNYSENVLFSDDFLVLELAKPSSFKPVKLAAADDSDFKAGKWATTMGWGTNVETNGTYPDSGGPLIMESSTEGNSTEDVLVGVVSWSKDNTCAREGYYGVYSRVSSVRAWIDSITGGNGTCLS